MCHTHFPKDPARLTDLHGWFGSISGPRKYPWLMESTWVTVWMITILWRDMFKIFNDFLDRNQKTKGVTAEQNNVLIFYLTSGSAQTHHHNWREAMLVLSKLVFSLTHRTWQGFGSACKLICFSHNLLTVWNPGTLIWRPERSHISELVGHCQANVRDVAVFSGFGHGKQNLQQNAKCKQVGGKPKKTNNDF